MKQRNLPIHASGEKVINMEKKTQKNTNEIVKEFRDKIAEKFSKINEELYLQLWYAYGQLHTEWSA